MEPRHGHCSPVANGETDRRKLKLATFVCRTEARSGSGRIAVGVSDDRGDLSGD